MAARKRLRHIVEVARERHVFLQLVRSLPTLQPRGDRRSLAGAMDGEDLYDEFGNYIGPDLESDESEAEEGEGEGGGEEGDMVRVHGEGERGIT